MKMVPGTVEPSQALLGWIFETNGGLLLSDQDFESLLGKMAITSQNLCDRSTGHCHHRNTINEAVFLVFSLLIELQSA
jgi:hypothetical protein